ncbi:MAG: 4'-phosphopantetheinyl transferase superfamily protein [Lachnospiraceae bacterium]|nr:4'-phosphopantetheinyl transferase superfamily protein [Lachnospiraceae bacterium]
MIHLYISSYKCNGGPEIAAAAHEAGLELLQEGLKKSFGFELDDMGVISAGEHGKPFLKGHYGINFSISHSNGIVLLALSDSGIGADIEKIRVFKPGLISRILTQAEQDTFLRSSEDSREEFFFRYWTLKEAWLKFAGLGIGGGFKSCEFFPETFDSGICRIPSRVSADPDRIIYSYGFRACSGDDIYCGAICSESEDIPLIIQSEAVLL